MKKSILAITTFLLLHWSQADLANGTFSGLDFENTFQTSTYPYVHSPWTINFDSGYINVNSERLNMGPNATFNISHTNISLTVRSGAYDPEYDLGAGVLSQTGRIDNRANSIYFEYSGSNLDLQVNGNSVPISEISAGIFAGDIRAWAGKPVTLAFIVNVPTNGTLWMKSEATIDNIIFSDRFMPAEDLDSDQILDNWEIEYFGTIENCDPNGDPDGDYFSNLAEFNNGTDPDIWDPYTNYFQLQWQSTLGSNYQVQACGNLISNNWVDVGSLVSGTNGIDSIVFPTIHEYQFYRVITVP